MKKDQRNRDTVALAGWLFADLLLGIGLLFFVADSKCAPITPTPTSTATATALPTLPPGVTPTITPSPTATPLGTPGTKIGLNQIPYRVILRTDPELFLRGKTDKRGTAEKRFQDQIQECFNRTRNSRVGLVLATGSNPDSANGRRFALSAIDILKKYGAPFEQSTVYKDYFNLSGDDPSLNGTVELEVYYIEDPQAKIPEGILGATCDAPPETWCEGNPNGQKLEIVNWASPALPFSIGGTNYTIKPAFDGVYRTIGCIQLSPGRYNWNAGHVQGTINIESDKANRLEICREGLCPTGRDPVISGPGTQRTPTPAR